MRRRTNEKMEVAFWNMCGCRTVGNNEPTTVDDPCRFRDKTAPEMRTGFLTILLLLLVSVASL